MIDDTSRAEKVVDMNIFMKITHNPESLLTDAENVILTRDLIQSLFTGISPWCPTPTIVFMVTPVAPLYFDYTFSNFTKLFPLSPTSLTSTNGSLCTDLPNTTYSLSPTPSFLSLLPSPLRLVVSPTTKKGNYSFSLLGFYGNSDFQIFSSQVKLTVRGNWGPPVFNFSKTQDTLSYWTVTVVKGDRANWEMPEIWDPDGDGWEIKVDLGKAGAWARERKGYIEIEPDQSAVVGVDYLVKIELKDDNIVRQMSSTYKLVIKVENAEFLEQVAQ